MSLPVYGGYVLLVVVASLLAAPFLVRLAARRTVAQPVPFDVEAERDVVSGVLSRPEYYPAVSALEPEMFVDEGSGRTWGLVKELVRDANDGEDLEGKDEKEVAALAERMPDDLAATVARLAPGNAGVQALTTTLRDDVTLDSLLKSGGTVLSAAEDRTKYPGSAPIEPGGPGEAQLVRRYQAPGRGRTLFSGIVLAVVLTVVPYFAALSTQSPTAWLLATGALAVLAVMGLLVALIDHDTLYIDFPVFWTGAGLSWALAVAAAFADDAPGRLLHGVGIALVLAAFFELTNKVYKLVRGSEGMGFGDTLIILATCGVPAAVAGDATIGLYSMIGGCFAGIGHWAVLRALKKADKDTPFAFGPGLALGWVFAWPLVMLFGMLAV